MLKGNKEQLQSAQELLRLLPRSSGFEPYALVAFAYCEDERGDGLRRSFRFEAGTCCTHLSIEAPRPSRWRTALGQRLGEAGYELWFSQAGSVDLRRWLRTSAERRRELRLLADLGVEGAVARWPRRIVRCAPARDDRWRAPRAVWLRVARDICKADVRWDDVCLCMSRTAEVHAPTPSGSVQVTVSVLPIVQSTGRREYYVAADISDPAAKRPPPPIVARVFGRFLRAEGLVPDGVRSTKSGKVDRTRVGFDVFADDARSATRTAQRAFAGLVSLGFPSLP